MHDDVLLAEIRPVIVGPRRQVLSSTDLSTNRSTSEEVSGDDSLPAEEMTAVFQGFQPDSPHSTPTVLFFQIMTFHVKVCKIKDTQIQAINWVGMYLCNICMYPYVCMYALYVSVCISLELSLRL